MERSQAVDRVMNVLETIDRDPMPVPIREVWVYGDLALGLDPIQRLDIYLSKDLLFAGNGTDPDRATEFEREFGVAGIGTTVSAEWADKFPECIRTNANGHAAPERCLAAHLTAGDEPIHLEVCNASFEKNVTQRIRGANATDRWEEVLDPRGVCLWQDNQHSEFAPERLRAGGYVFPPLEEALELLGLDPDRAKQAARAYNTWREQSDGRTVRGEVI